METRRWRHMGITKAYLYKLVQVEGPKVLRDFVGTKEEALEAILDLPYETLVVGDCDHQANGECLGHEGELPKD